MKKLFFKLVSITLIIILNSCDDHTEIREEKDYFSCSINGQLYVPEALDIESTDVIDIGNKSNKAASFNTISILAKGDYTIKIVILSPKLGKNSLNDELKDVFDSSLNGMIVKNEVSSYYTQKGRENGFINFTELSGNATKGTFECTLYDKKGKELKVTNGKFNI